MRLCPAATCGFLTLRFWYWYFLMTLLTVSSNSFMALAMSLKERRKREQGFTIQFSHIVFRSGAGVNSIYISLTNKWAQMLMLYCLIISFITQIHFKISILFLIQNLNAQALHVWHEYTICVLKQHYITLNPVTVFQQIHWRKCITTSQNSIYCT